MMNREAFRQRLAQGALLLDGAMGTLLHARGASIDVCFDVLNIQNPALVADIHRSYIDAGADIIETNSFGANRYKLAEYGLQAEVAAINEAAVNVARRAIAGSFKPALLAGSVGPLGVRLAPLGRVTAEQAQAAFAEQIAALVGAPQGIDLLILETMSDLKELETAVSAARAIAPDIPIIAQMTFTRDDRTLLGHTAVAVARKLAQLDLDVIGVNCSGGPAQVLRLVAIIHQLAPDIPLSAAPNAGWPEQIDGGRVLYPATPGYFGEYARAFVAAGACVVGGCCGTTGAHIAAMRTALDDPTAVTRPVPHVQVMSQEEELTAVVDEPTQLATFLNNKTYVVTVEMSPPRGVASHRLLEGARMLKEAGANILNIADSPLARMHMSAWAAAHLVQKEVGVETILHFPTRGRNLLRVQGDLLAAYAMGIRNLFVVMGDPTRIGDYPEAMDTYDIVPTGLISLIKEQFNRGLDKAGQSIDQATNFTVGCAINLTPHDWEREMTLLHKKKRNGADFALSQPVFEPQTARAFIEAYEAKYGEPMLPIVAGVKPLYNSRNAEFLHHEVPGMIIPEAQRERMRLAANPQEEGVKIAQEILAEIRPFTHGVYFMPAFGRYDLVADVMDIL
ncbi:MAG: bifunctional homocysteine S-methyltransferase/methylenetetrahydrofolate reductase [Chloroflexi bacterium]|nr:bifunctional homocysteine S-methyltransferase/methylenetetrahydrofolate reductase [Chloroflexota bacterium]MBK7180204.1 bifunctional homocysteine S-methyltransferase/methylenetetrahydrofolate reductase [Chloroflexota bacterium]MBK7918446.1 bifunctional homocysteine S-methyltransferase/methylenetetrahydrofolate reductase [Chloroflexota bacterium]